MPFAILAPLFIAGMGLIAIPIYIHHIRRPEREPIKFSSLMFVPVSKKEVIERRRIQHLLLLLLRILAILLLALAFSRPFWKSKAVAAATAAGEGGGWHVVLLDTSYSMGAEGQFDAARTAAIDEVQALDARDLVGVATFGLHPKIVAPFEAEADAVAASGAEEPGSKAAAIAALREAKIGEEATNYLTALQGAESMLLKAAGEAEFEDEKEGAKKLHVHLVTDFQKQGLPEDRGGWRLSSRIQLHAKEIGKAPERNRAVADVSVRKSANGELRAVGKVKNWSPEFEEPMDAKLVVDGKDIESKPVKVKSGNATQVAFKMEQAADKAVKGFIETAADDLAADNRRAFVWEPARKVRLLLVSDDKVEAPRTAPWILAQALVPTADSPYALETIAQDKLAERLGVATDVPDAVLLFGVKQMNAQAVGALTGFVRAGGAALIAIDAATQPDAANDALLPALGLKAAGPVFEETRDSRFRMIAWIDFENEIFFPFQGARFNDFSHWRFFNYNVLSVAPDAKDTKVVAKFEAEGTADDGPPAIVETKIGEGRVVVWGFGVSLDDSNVARSVKFVPVLEECLQSLIGQDKSLDRWTVGEAPRAPEALKDKEPAWRLLTDSAQSAGAENVDADSKETVLRTGFVQWKAKDAEDWAFAQPVNVDPNESNPERITPAEFQLRLASSAAETPDAPADDQSAAAILKTMESGKRTEFGLWIVAAVLGFFLIESLYAARLAR